MKRSSQILLSLVAMSLMVVTLSCGLIPSGTNGTKTAYIYIPGATFHSGTPPPATGANSAKQVVATPSGKTLSESSPVAWTITWDPTLSADSIVIYDVSLSGYFEIQLTDTEETDGSLSAEEYVSESPPTTQTCNLDYHGNGTCYETAPQGTTETDAQVSFIGADSSVGTYLDVSISLDFVWVAPSNSGATCSAAYSMCNCSVEACCSTSQCYYLVGSTTYDCSGLNCDGAAQTLVSACCPTQ